MIPPVKQRKDELRREYKAKRRSIPAEEKLRRDREICRYAQSLASFRYAEYVLLYDALIMLKQNDRKLKKLGNFTC